MESDQIAYCAALLKQIPVAASGQHLLGIGPHGDLLTSALAHFHAYKQIEWRSPSHSVFLNESSWPFPDSSFDILVFSQTLESLASDPMRAMSEINRILKPGGTLILTAPNIGSAKSLHALLRGVTPYIDGRFSIASRETWPHREYTASEIETLAVAAGFGKVEIETRSIFWRPMDALMPSLAASGFSVASRGDTLFLRACKDSAVRDRFPAKLYDLSSPEARKLMHPASDAPMRILVIFETLPLPDGGGADHRLLQMIRLLRDEGHSVTFLAPRSAGNGLRASLLKDLGMDVFLEDSEVLRTEGIDLVSKWTLQQVLREGQFDLAIASLWFWMGVTLPEHYLDEIRCLSPLTRIAILTDDCHGIREQGGAQISGLWSDRERAVDFTEREMEAYRRSDLVICISESDKEQIARELGPDAHIEVLPMMIEAPAGARIKAEPEKKNPVILSEAKDPSSPFSLSSSSFPPFDHREGIVYLGHFNNPPTLDGLEWYIREVSPLVRKSLPDLKLYVVGAGLPDDWSSPDPYVIRVGFKLDLAAEFAQRRILVSPVRFGTGIKTKNLHALANGLPIVTNAKGAEGAGLISGETAVITDDPAEFAAAVVNLYTDPALWTKLSENSRAHAQKYFSKDAMQASLRKIGDRIRSLKPQPYDPSHIWSMRLVETMYSDVLNYQPARQRHNIRVLAYARAAEQLFAQGNAAEARRQLRHVFNYFSHSVSRGIFFNSFLSVAESMDRAYRALGEIDGAREFRREARSINPSAFPESELSAHVSTRQVLHSAATPAPPSARSGEITQAPAKNIALSEAKPRRNKRNNSSKLDISVIVPTYNRSHVLRECLQALKRQSLSPRRFEVIVVDDGSTDGTRLLCSNHDPRHEFHYLAQANAGAGAARRVGVDYAKGKYLLFINDDTIASPTLLARHLDLHRSRNQEKLAVLGNFKLPDAAKSRALTWFLATQPFLFPHVGLKPGLYEHHSFFITCNISVRRDLVVAAGSFDPDFRVAEDTELGVRLIQKGVKILYAPELESIHQHLDFTIPDLIRRAEVYGNKLVQLFRKHPTLLAGGRGVLGTLDANSLEKINVFIEQHQAEIPAAIESLSKFDSIDFSPFFEKKLDGRNASDAVMDLFTRSIPVVYWYHLFRSFLAAREAEISSAIPAQPGSAAAQSVEI